MAGSHLSASVFHSLCAKLFQLYLTLCNPMDCSLPISSVHGIFQARILEGKNALLQGISPTQGLNPHPLCLLIWQANSLPQVPPGKPTIHSLWDRSICLPPGRDSTVIRLFCFLRLKNRTWNSGPKICQFKPDLYICRPCLILIHHVQKLCHISTVATFWAYVLSSFFHYLIFF